VSICPQCAIEPLDRPQVREDAGWLLSMSASFDDEWQRASGKFARIAGTCMSCGLGFLPKIVKLMCEQSETEPDLVEENDRLFVRPWKEPGVASYP